MVKERKGMKIKVQDSEIKVSFDAYMVLKKENPTLEVISYCDHSVEDKYTDEIIKCRTLTAHINNMMNLLPSPEHAIYTDYNSACAVYQHLYMIYDMLKSWTGFE